MGVFHFMGLGRSPGAVTAAISYLAARYERWNDSDANFFATSGEFGQEGKRGDVQALVLFTTQEVINGKRDGLCSDYVENPAGQSRGKAQMGEAMAKVLKRVLPPDLKRAAGGRDEVALYWCEIDRADLRVTFERVARVIYAAKPAGEVGKEIWINLTGGSNIVNLALQLAAALLSGPARLYYLRSDNPDCLRHTTPIRDLGTKDRDHFWVDIPVIYLRLDDATRVILEVLDKAETPLSDDDLLSRLRNDPAVWSDFVDTKLVDLRRNYLLPMAGQQLVSRVSEHTVTVGQQWAVLKGYYEIVADLRRPDSDAETNLMALAQRHAWFREETIVLS
jgi:hypothetical protein